MFGLCYASFAHTVFPVLERWAIGNHCGMLLAWLASLCTVKSTGRGRRKRWDSSRVGHMNCTKKVILIQNEIGLVLWFSQRQLHGSIYVLFWKYKYQEVDVGAPALAEKLGWVRGRWMPEWEGAKILNFEMGGPGVGESLASLVASLIHPPSSFFARYLNL